MNLSRFAIVFLALVPTALFIAAAETAPDPAPQAATQKKNPAQQETAAPRAADAAVAPSASPPASATTAVPTSAPLRTALPSAALPGTERADDTATASILGAIRADRGMAGSDVSVHTDNGVVTITGLVRNREQAAIASAYANRQLGVLRVDNQLSIPAQ